MINDEYLVNAWWRSKVSKDMILRKYAENDEEQF